MKWGNRVRAFLITSPVVLLLCATAMPSQAFYLPDTSQKKCYQAVAPYAEIPCAGTGQDGAYSIHPLNYTDNGDGTVTDNNTGLMWQQRDSWLQYDWYNAPIHCGEILTGNYTDWRLPTKKELMSIVDYAIPWQGPLIAPVFTNDPGAVHAAPYWSSTPYAGGSGPAWMVSFLYGDVETYTKSVGWYIRCVRGGRKPGSHPH